MDELREKLRSVEATQPPDLWEMIMARTEDGPDTYRHESVVAFRPRAAERRRRVTTIATAAAVFAVGAVLVWQGFRSPSERPLLPAERSHQIARCTNEIEGYMIGYPAGWFTTEIFNGERDPANACRWFDTQPFDPEEGNIVLEGVAYPLEVGVRTGSLDDVVADETTDGVRVLVNQETSVDGRVAVRLELRSLDGVLIPTGTRVYEYLVELSPDRTLRVFTADLPGIAGSYQDNKAVVDRAAEELQLEV